MRSGRLSAAEYGDLITLTAGCGVNALSGLQNCVNSINCDVLCRPEKRRASGNPEESRMIIRL
ncbi:hypothetical protein, partial [Piscirickettsia salmonis]|uniref:hypothetical protein n=1 Tax=Piscirickettsia salmonis TaxID=1238 RepID=UPI001C54E887